MATTLAALKQRVRLLSLVDGARDVFGADDHNYDLAPPLTREELDALEARIGPLPAAYRTFVTEVGSHGAGPYYGLLEATSPIDDRLPLAEQGCGGRSMLVLTGLYQGEVWADWTREGGEILPEAPSFLAWYATWLDDALVEWVSSAAPRIALDGPETPDELEAVAIAFECVARKSPGNAPLLRTLGYLHARERRWEDARAAFDAAAQVNDDEPEARRALDGARLHLVMEAYPQAVAEAERGLAREKLWHLTRDELRDCLERALGSLGRNDEALAVLDARAEDEHFSFVLHHRLARERLARGDLDGAGRALERAANKHNILGEPSVFDDRLAASFAPIIGELTAGGSAHEAAFLEALADRIRTAN